MSPEDAAARITAGSHIYFKRGYPSMDGSVDVDVLRYSPAKSSVVREYWFYSREGDRPVTAVAISQEDLLGLLAAQDLSSLVVPLGHQPAIAAQVARERAEHA